jgi:hypothetical protein
MIKGKWLKLLLSNVACYIDFMGGRIGPEWVVELNRNEWPICSGIRNSSIEELQADLDTWIDEYNTQRTHSGKYSFGKTPLQTFRDSKHLADAKMLDQIQEENDPAPIYAAS